MQQFVGASSPTARPSDGLKTWQRTVLAEMGLIELQQQRQGQQRQGQGQQQGEEGQEREGQEPEQPQRPVVAIGGDPPVQGPLLAACRVMLSEVCAGGCPSARACVARVWMPVPRVCSRAAHAARLARARALRARGFAAQRFEPLGVGAWLGVGGRGRREVRRSCTRAGPT